ILRAQAARAVSANHDAILLRSLPRIPASFWRLGSQNPTALEHFSKRLNRGIPLRERIGFKVHAGVEASMDGETVFRGSACARRWGGTGWGYHPRNCGATWREYQLCRAFP